MSTTMSPGSVSEALEMLECAMGYLAAADATAMTAEAQARCLKGLERVTAIGTAARSSILGAFTSGQGYCADADYSPRAWLINKTRITKGAAVGYTAWVRRAAAHPQMAGTLAAGEISESFARTICTWTDRLPENCREKADEVLITAAKASMDLRGLAALAAEIAPIVTGDVNLDALDDLVRLCVLLDGLRHGTGEDASQMAPASDTTQAWEAIERAVIGKAVDLLSGPGGLASFLRRRQLGARLAGPSLPLDIGFSETIPAGIRNAVILRDRHCRWPGGCNQPAAACHVHHVKHKADGGATSVQDCLLLCSYHHLIVIHRWGWTLVLNPDGTTTAWNKDRTRVLHSHGPPTRAG